MRQALKNETANRAFERFQWMIGRGVFQYAQDDYIWMSLVMLDLALTDRADNRGGFNDEVDIAIMLRGEKVEFSLSDDGCSKLWIDLSAREAHLASNSSPTVLQRWKKLYEYYKEGEWD